MYPVSVGLRAALDVMNRPEAQELGSAGVNTHVDPASTGRI